jgi:lipoprotein-anchoring transpeptidase ErfK/SrfK
MRVFVEKPKATPHTTSARSETLPPARFGQNREASSILVLQRTIGNQAVQRLFEANAVSARGDSTTGEVARVGHDLKQVAVSLKRLDTAIETEREQRSYRMKMVPGSLGLEMTVASPEAVRVPDMMMSMPEPCPKCSKKPEAAIQTKPVADQAIPPIQRQAELKKAAEEEEPVQTKSLVQRQVAPEEEEKEAVQAKLFAMQQALMSPMSPTVLRTMDPALVQLKRGRKPKSGKKIQVDLNRQNLYAFDKGVQIYSFNCVSGDKHHPTPIGNFSVLRKHKTYTSKKYRVPMNYAMFFKDTGEAIHQAYSVGLSSYLKRWGVSYIGSHGCVRLAENDASTLFAWTPLGTPVLIH